MKLIDNIKERIPSLSPDWWEGRYSSYVKVLKRGEDKSQYDSLLPKPTDRDDTAVVVMLCFTEKPSVKEVEMGLLEMLREDYSDLSLVSSIHDRVEKDGDFFNCYFLFTFHTDEELSLPPRSDGQDISFQEVFQKLLEKGMAGDGGQPIGSSLD